MVETKGRDLLLSNIAIKARKVLGVASEVASDVIAMRDKPNVIDYFALGTKLANVAIDKFMGEVYNYFDSWYSIGDISFRETIVDVLRRRHNPKRIGGRDDYAIMVADVFGEDVGWIDTNAMKKSGEGSPVKTIDGGGPWIKFDRYDETFAAIGRAMWEDMNTNRIVLSNTANIRYDRNDTITHMKHDFEIGIDIHESPRSIELCERIKKFYDFGKKRSIILLGPPGTGKTTMMKYVASKFNKHTMRINISELAKMSADTIVAAVQVMQPEILLIDDFDRIRSSDNDVILTHLEQVNRAVKIFMVSVNNISRLDPAVIRPQRFDEIIEINTIGDAAIKALMADAPESVINAVRSWPISYVEELANRVEVVGYDAIEPELAELQLRIDNINGARYRGFSIDPMRVDDCPDDQTMSELERALRKDGMM